MTVTSAPDGVDHDLTGPIANARYGGLLCDQDAIQISTQGSELPGEPA